MSFSIFEATTVKCVNAAADYSSLCKTMCNIEVPLALCISVCRHRKEPEHMYLNLSDGLLIQNFAFLQLLGAYLGQSPALSTRERLWYCASLPQRKGKGLWSTCLKLGAHCKFIRLNVSQAVWPCHQEDWSNLGQADFGCRDRFSQPWKSIGYYNDVLISFCAFRKRSKNVNDDDIEGSCRLWMVYPPHVRHLRSFLPYEKYLFISDYRSFKLGSQ